MTKDQKENLADALNFIDDASDLIIQLPVEIVSEDLYSKLRKVYGELEEAYLAQSHRESD